MSRTYKREVIEHLYCTGCNTNPSVARIDGTTVQVCHCTHVDGDLEPVQLHGFDATPDRWEWRSEARDGQEGNENEQVVFTGRPPQGHCETCGERLNVQGGCLNCEQRGADYS